MKRKKKGKRRTMLQVAIDIVDDYLGKYRVTEFVFDDTSDGSITVNPLGKFDEHVRPLLELEGCRDIPIKGEFNPKDRIHVKLKLEYIDRYSFEVGVFNVISCDCYYTRRCGATTKIISREEAISHIVVMLEKGLVFRQYTL